VAGAHEKGSPTFAQDPLAQASPMLLRPLYSQEKREAANITTATTPCLEQEKSRKLKEKEWIFC
jgi:hypothetical protein